MLKSGQSWANWAGLVTFHVPKNNVDSLITGRVLIEPLDQAYLLFLKKHFLVKFLFLENYRFACKCKK